MGRWLAPISAVLPVTVFVAGGAPHALAAWGGESCGAAAPGIGGSAESACPWDEETSLLQSFLGRATRDVSASDVRVDAAMDFWSMDSRQLEQLKTSKSIRRSFVLEVLDHVTTVAQGGGLVISPLKDHQVKNLEEVVRGLLVKEHNQDKQLLGRLWNNVPALLTYVDTREGDFNKTFSKYMQTSEEHWACRADESKSCPKFDFCMNEMAFAEEEDRTEECETVIGECIMYRERCRKLQTMFEVEACNADGSANHVRDGYANRFTRAASAYETVASDVRVEEANRKVELGRLKELACICAGAASGSKEQALDVAACKELQTDTSSFDMSYHDVPASTFKALPDIPVPCSKEYMDALSRRLPPNTMPHECSQCRRPSLADAKDDYSSGFKEGYQLAFGAKPEEAAVPLESIEGSQSSRFGVEVEKRLADLSEDLRRSVKKRFGKGFAEGFDSGFAALRGNSHDSPSRQKAGGLTLEVAQSFEKGFEKGFMKSVNRQLQITKDRDQITKDEDQLSKDKVLLKSLQEIGKYPAKTQEEIKQAFWSEFDKSFENDFEQHVVQRSVVKGGPEVQPEREAMATVERSSMNEFTEVLA